MEINISGIRPPDSFDVITGGLCEIQSEIYEAKRTLKLYVEMSKDTQVISEEDKAECDEMGKRITWYTDTLLPAMLQYIRSGLLITTDKRVARFLRKHGAEVSMACYNPASTKGGAECLKSS